MKKVTNDIGWNVMKLIEEETRSPEVPCSDIEKLVKELLLYVRNDGHLCEGFRTKEILLRIKSATSANTHEQ